MVRIMEVGRLRGRRARHRWLRQGCRDGAGRALVRGTVSGADVRASKRQ